MVIAESFNPMEGISIALRSCGDEGMRHLPQLLISFVMRTDSMSFGTA